MKRKRIGLAALSVALVAIIAAALFFSKTIKLNTPSATRYPVRGVDVSEYQGEIDWPVLAAQGIDFAFIKATEGSSYVDPYFAANWDNVQDTHLLYSAYHFFSFDSPAARQAESFIQTVPRAPQTLSPVVDIELYGDHKRKPPAAAQVREELQVMLDELEKNYGAKPIIYTTALTYQLYISGHFLEYPIWIRDVYFTPSLEGTREWAFWQYSDTGVLDGYHGEEKHIDLNVFCGTYSELEVFLVEG